MSPTILALPQEIIEMVAYLLSPTDLVSFRSTCRALEEKSFRCFGATAFGSRTCTLTGRSLRILLCISSSRLAVYVQALKVKYITEYPSFTACNEFWNEKRAKTRRIQYVAACRFYSEQQTSVEHSGLDQLRRIFKSLPSLQSLSIKACAPGFDALNNCLEQPLPETDPSRHNKGISFKAPLILTAARDAGISLKLLRGNMQEQEVCLVDFLNVKEKQTVRFSALTSSLETLCLQGNLEDAYRLRLGATSIDCSEALPSFLSGMKQLRKLSLWFQFDDAPAGAMQLLEKSFFPNLEVFALVTVSEIDEDNLLAFISRHRKTLGTLQLHDLVMSHGTWSSFFKRLRHAALRLDYLSVGPHIRKYDPRCGFSFQEAVDDESFAGLAASFEQTVQANTPRR